MLELVCFVWGLGWKLCVWPAVLEIKSCIAMIFDDSARAKRSPILQSIWWKVVGNLMSRQEFSSLVASIDFHCFFSFGLDGGSLFAWYSNLHLPVISCYLWLLLADVRHTDLLTLHNTTSVWLLCLMSWQLFLYTAVSFHYHEPVHYKIKLFLNICPLFSHGSWTGS